MIPGFDLSNFPHGRQSYPLYTKGQGPGVVVIHELPGLTKECIALANRLVDAGYRVYMPLLFGNPGEKAVTRNLLRVCISREFSVFAMNKSSPVVEWLKAVCAKALGECGGPGVGAIGMCLTGNFAISLMADPIVLAPVSCQPSLPFPVTKKRKAALAMSPEELRAAKHRATEGQDLMCFRFSCDNTSPEERFNKLAEEFGTAFKGTQIDSSKDNPHRIRAKAHSVLTSDFVNKAGHPTREAMDRVLAFFEERLTP
ncbi:unnamed protein product [Laminaria digitata]